MTQLKPKFIVDESGNRVAVVLEMAEYNALLEALEELDDIAAYDAAKKEGGEAIPFEQAMKEIERKRR